MTSRWASWLGIAYILAVLLATFNVVLFAWGAPHLRILVGDGSVPLNQPGLTLLSLFAVVVIGAAAWQRAGTALQWWMLAAIALWLGSVVLSLAFQGSVRDVRFLAMALIVTGIAAAAMLADPGRLRATLLVLGWFYGWGSVAVGISSALSGAPPVLVSDDERYGRWLSMLGLDLGDVAFLNGVAPGRVYVGLTCGLLLVYTVRVLLTGSYAKWWWLSPVGLLAATAWSFSRTGMLIIAVGVLLTLAPWQRIRAGWLIATVFGLSLLPLTVSPLLALTPISDGTTVWRFDLWRDYVTDPQMWTPFGIGPKPASLEYADHAHQQLLEAQATGGWLGLAGCIAFIALACLAARRASFSDNRAAIAVLFGMAVIFQLDVITFSSIYSVVNNAQVIIVAVLVAAARLPRTTDESTDDVADQIATA